MKKLISLCLVFAMVAVSSSLRAADSPGTAGSASYEAAREFWEVIHQPYMKQALIDVVKQLKVEDPDEAHAKAVRQAFRALAQAAIEKNKRIASLPLLKVDPDAVAFAAKAAAYRIELASLCELVAEKSESDAQLPDELGGKFLLSLVRHMNEKEGMLLNVIRDSTESGTDTISKARSEWVSLTARLSAFTERGNQLQIDEMMARALLSARYGHEFFPASSYPDVVAEKLKSKNAK